MRHTKFTTDGHNQSAYRQVGWRSKRMLQTDLCLCWKTFGLQAEQYVQSQRSQRDTLSWIEWWLTSLALNKHQSVNLSERIRAHGWPCHLHHLYSNSFEKEEELEKRDVRKKKKEKECRMAVIGRGQLRARKRVWLHYTWWSIVLQK